MYGRGNGSRPANGPGGDVVRVLVLDVEAVVDADLIRETYGCTPAERLAQIREYDPDEKMLPSWTFRPVVVVVASLADDGSVSRVGILRADDSRYGSPTGVAASFWERLRAIEKEGFRLVTYNGGRFDLPVLEAEAWRSGVVAPNWFMPGAKSWQDPRGKFCTAHVDLAEQFSAYGRGGPRPPLRALAQMVGAPRRRIGGPTGEDVAALWAGSTADRDLVVGRCVVDVLDTWLVDLRLSRLAGYITGEQERAAVASSLTMGEGAPLPALAARYADVGAWFEDMGGEL